MNEFEKWCETFLRDIDRCLSLYGAQTRDQKGAALWRAFYVLSEKDKKRYVTSLRAVPTKGRVTIELGVPHRRLKVPPNGPEFRYCDSSHPDYPSFDVPLGNQGLRTVALDLMVQVASNLTGLKV